MNNRTLKYMLVTFISSIFIIIFLFKLSDIRKHKKNAFFRSFPPHLVNAERSIDLKFNSYYLSSTKPGQVYLGNYSAPSKIMVFESLGDTISPIPRTLEISQKIQSTAMIEVDYPLIFIQEPKQGIVNVGNLFGPANKSIFKVDENNFSTCMALSPASFVIRTYDQQYHQNILKKVSFNPFSTRKAPNILEKQIDGIFCTDGMLLLNKKRSLLIYVYFYRNQFLCLDTNLNILYKGRTIDTFSRAHIKVATVKSENEIMMSEPPVLVNRKSSINDRFLFINSSLKADNETEKIFKNYFVVDVYSLSNGAYKFSFYLSKMHGNKLNDFKVINQTLYAFIDHHLVVYHLNF